MAVQVYILAQWFEITYQHSHFILRTAGNMKANAIIVIMQNISAEIFQIVGWVGFNYNQG